MISPIIVAELGSTHDGSIGIALNAIRAFAAAGATHVKFQDHRGQDVAADAPRPIWFQDEPRRDYFRRTEFTQREWERLAEQCAAAGVALVVSPFSAFAARSQAELGAALKVASGQVTNLGLLSVLAGLGRPVWLSSGMSTWLELDAAVGALGDSCGAVMHCVSEYPTPPERWGLVGIRELQARYELSVGYSNHAAPGSAAPAIAAYMGASPIELHVTLSRHLYGSDAPHSYEPDEFAAEVGRIRAAWEAGRCQCPRDRRIQSDAIKHAREVFLDHG